MTLKELARTYHFHDCTVLAPFKQEGNDITFAVDLAKHLQYDELKQAYGAAIGDRDRHLVVIVKMLRCTQIKAVIETYDADGCVSRSTQPLKRSEVSLSDFDWALDDRSLDVDGTIADGLYAHFSKGDTYGHISFLAEEAVVLREECLGDADFGLLYDEWCET